MLSTVVAFSLSGAGQEGLEPPTAGFGDRCSAKLSYCPLQASCGGVHVRIAPGGPSRPGGASRGCRAGRGGASGAGERGGRAGPPAGVSVEICTVFANLYLLERLPPFSVQRMQHGTDFKTTHPLSRPRPAHRHPPAPATPPAPTTDPLGAEPPVEERVAPRKSIGGTRERRIFAGEEPAAAFSPSSLFHDRVSAQNARPAAGPTPTGRGSRPPGPPHSGRRVSWSASTTRCSVASRKVSTQYGP